MADNDQLDEKICSVQVIKYVYYTISIQ